MAGLLDKLAGTDDLIRVNADLKAEWVYDDCIGADPVFLRLYLGKVDMRPLRDACSHELAPFPVVARAAKCCLTPLCATDFANLVDLVVMVLAAGPPLDWLAKQVIWQVGSLLDRAVVRRRDEHPSAAAAEGQMLHLSGRQTAAPQELVPWKKVGGDSFRSRQADLYRYIMAMRSAMQDQPPVLSCGTDARRVGKRAVTLVAFVLPNNVAMWGPPQVRIWTGGSRTVRGGSRTDSGGPRGVRVRTFSRRFWGPKTAL